MSSFSGLSVALSALQAQRKRLDIANQNIANANTPGYTRQRVELESIGPVPYSSMHGKPREVGDGVQVGRVTRMMDQFALNRLRGHEASAGYHKTMDVAYNEIEKRLAEPTDKGLTKVMGDFLASWGDVANRPNDPASRTALLQEANTTIGTLNQAARDTGVQWHQTNQRAESFINEINESSVAIAELNDEIRVGKILGHPVSELQDKRDSLITKLSTIAGVKVTDNLDANGEPDGQLNLELAGASLVTGKVATAVTLASAGDLNTAAAGTTTAVEVGGTTVNLTKGQLGATLNALNTTLVDVIKGYNQVAADLANQVNTIHTAAYDLDGNTGNTFFTGTTAATISLTTTDINKIAVSAAAGNTFNGDAANALATLATNANGPISSWQTMVGDIGVQASGTRVRAQAAEIQRGDAAEILDSSAGVDIDEEMVGLVATQRAYQAAARLMTAVDEALDLIINRTGRVGR